MSPVDFKKRQCPLSLSFLVDFKIVQCPPVDFKKGQCTSPVTIFHFFLSILKGSMSPVEFKKRLCRPVEFN